MAAQPAAPAGQAAQQQGTATPGRATTPDFETLAQQAQALGLGQPSTPAARPGAANIAALRGGVPVEIVREENFQSLRFGFIEPVGAAVFGRDQNLWIAFDRVVDIDLAPLMRRVRGDTKALGDIQGTVSGAANLLVPLNRPAAARGTVTLDALRLVVAGDEWRNSAPVLIRKALGPGASEADVEKALVFFMEQMEPVA